MYGRLRILAVAVLAAHASPASANPRDSIPVTPMPEATAPAPHPVPAPTAGPRIDGATTAFRLPRVTADTSVVALQRRNRDVSKPVAIMIVGGAAIILGSVVDGDAGDLIVIGGVVALLYGLYQYLK